MRKYRKTAYALAITVLGFVSVAAHAQSCTTPAPTDFYVDKDNSAASDSANGHYTTASGGTVMTGVMYPIRSFGGVNSISICVQVFPTGDCLRSPAS